MPTAALLRWGWRLPFLFGISIGIVGYFIRRELQHGAVIAHAQPPPMFDVLRTQWGRILRVAGFNVLDAVGFYLMFVYATTYLEQVVGIAKGHALAINTIGMATAVLMPPLAGQLSDRNRFSLYRRSVSGELKNAPEAQGLMA